jgi:hypothetical protein
MCIWKSSIVRVIFANHHIHEVLQKGRLQNYVIFSEYHLVFAVKYMYLNIRICYDFAKIYPFNPLCTCGT